MTRLADETYMEYLRRIISHLDFEYEDILEDLPNIHAVVDYFELWDAYDTEYMEGVLDALELGANPKPYNDFVRKHKLPWKIWRKGKLTFDIITGKK